MERGKPDIEEHEGEKYLSLLGLSHLADTPVATASGSIEVRDFLDICGDHARPILIGLEAMDQSDPRYEPTREALRGLISQYIGVPPETS